MTGSSVQTKACSYAVWPSQTPVSTTARPSNMASFSPCFVSTSRSSLHRNLVTSYLDSPEQEAGSVTLQSTACGTETSCLSWTIRTSTAWRSFATEFGRKSANRRRWSRPTVMVRVKLNPAVEPVLLYDLKLWLQVLRSSSKVHLRANRGCKLEVQQWRCQHGARTPRKLNQTWVCWAARSPRTTRRHKTVKEARPARPTLRQQLGGRERVLSMQPSGDECRKTRRGATGGPTSCKDPHVAFEEKHKDADLHKHKSTYPCIYTQAHPIVCVSAEQKSVNHTLKGRNMWTLLM